MGEQTPTQTTTEATKPSTTTKPESSSQEKSTSPSNGKASPSKGKSSKGKAGKTRKSKGSGITLEQAQKAAQSQMKVHSASMDQIVGFMSKKKNVGQAFSPSEIATGVGNGATDRDVRKALQRKGLAGSEGKTGVIQTGDFFLYLEKSGNKNRYRLLPEGTPPPASN